MLLAVIEGEARLAPCRHIHVGIGLCSTHCNRSGFNCTGRECTHLVGDLGALGSLGRLSKEDKSDREDQEDRDEESLNGSHDAWLWPVWQRGSWKFITCFPVLARWVEGEQQCFRDVVLGFSVKRRQSCPGEGPTDSRSSRKHSYRSSTPRQ
jgi:hypothetical protein